MDQRDGMFTVKLSELEQEYEQMRDRIQKFQGKNAKQVHQERERLLEEYHAHDLLLDNTVRSCRSRAMARMAEIQRDYGAQVENLLQSDPLADRQESGCGEHAEAMALYAEFAIDFAMQAMRYALITALSAMELQMQADENTKKGDCDTYE